ncbi:hypothetical protein [Salininema proteolyticum]|uniref:Uncharacterized protein n=1 Tax=Salininema proteolyticum TaxID=1607685 RepID=A0ABV8U1E9_9ACTN
MTDRTTDPVSHPPDPDTSRRLLNDRITELESQGFRTDITASLLGIMILLVLHLLVTANLETTAATNVFRGAVYFAVVLAFFALAGIGASIYPQRYIPPPIPYQGQQVAVDFAPPPQDIVAAEHRLHHLEQRVAMKTTWFKISLLLGAVVLLFTAISVFPQLA